MEFLYFIIVGGIAGWLAGQIMKGGGFGLITNIILGIIGGVVGGWLLGVAGVSVGGGLVGSIITSAIGAMAVIFIAGLFKK
ncbi:MAG: GlsB/YeaQ/YmgE family stress response membrane protein [Saprospiraceae bacterium]|nr:GlsB/YeaQ/YmgE family stress response membrane protein [Saprospiraceae bacterium]|mmetsp:Transcript_28976/g.70517  ORF Transcript_28976/g.70517 Transcript_28976/m.70517 type:complete len:81 (+) Transcript_28976:88-330(+)|eukprot:CAMPEP_0198338886 /NCGR_PEP_ID=MMETSP1450-20131203/37607_1 /TAXON_ID=753684 ORGANISM="Madagascaria erythrocladiodes, Strain CCMP3234" /NCGR_SAMPLE_ID=MMETSP1450 /ASSEMBLY_ACC=CAM_ASM_001115 /LENGTH=80 /DNA_ID=CAMNT_0044043785 /DNA_START=73 /DNA_END=315 /DNA_ORIENTATION=-